MHPIIIVICLAAVPVIYALIRISRELDLLKAIDPTPVEDESEEAFEAEVQELMAQRSASINPLHTQYLQEIAKRISRSDSIRARESYLKLLDGPILTKEQFEDFLRLFEGASERPSGDTTTSLETSIGNFADHGAQPANQASPEQLVPHEHSLLQSTRGPFVKADPTCVPDTQAIALQTN